MKLEMLIENILHFWKFYFDIINKRNLFISISLFNRNIKLWNFNKLELIFNYQSVYNSVYLHSHVSYIITIKIILLQVIKIFFIPNFPKIIPNIRRRVL